jgi:membrane protease YdiL (CAAX protease family)
VVFGLLHAYQGPLGMMRTALLGLLLAASLLLSGSIWPAITAHVALDLLGGLVWGERFAR